MTTTAASRVVLLLQGPRSPFFARLADALCAEGARVRRVLFCPGDELFWIGRPATRWRDSAEDWPAAAEELMRREGVTDVVGLGDGRAIHRGAFAAARRLGVSVHVVEQGFLRPGWLTVERDALASWRPDGVEAPHGSAGTPVAPSFRTSFASFAAMDVCYDLANVILAGVLYPGYRHHAAHSPLAEWRGWIGKALRWPRRARERRRALDLVANWSGPIFLLALQLESDFQIRDRGPKGGLRIMLSEVLASFRAFAPPEAMIVVKLHPLDPQLAPWSSLISEAGLGRRAVHLDGGDLEALLPRLAGLITANSTAGISALRAGVPTLCLGDAFYDLQGLTHRHGLNAFWTQPDTPRSEAVEGFVQAVADATQVPGGFDGEGAAVGARNVARKILSSVRTRAQE